MEVNSPIFISAIQHQLLWMIEMPLAISVTGLSPSTVGFFQSLLRYFTKEHMFQSPNPTSLECHHSRFSLFYVCFQSPLLTESQLISFPTVTKMFQFTVFPFKYGLE